MGEYNEYFTFDNSIYITNGMKLSDLLNFCLIQKGICDDPESKFWATRLTIDFPREKIKENISKKQNYINFYMIRGLMILKEKLKWEGTIYELYNAKGIYSSRKGITEIPEEIELLIYLQKLFLNNNQIREIPDNLPNSLRQLVLDNNQIKEIPDNLPDSLQILNLKKNNIEKIPDNLPRSLRELNLYNNQIREIPDNLPESLQYLNLNNNNITSMPNKLPNSLREFLLLDNHIRKIPIKIRLKHLNTRFLF